MKIREILLDRIIESKLFEMAFEKKIAMDKARHLQNQIARHMIKIAMYGKSDYVKHWIQEVDGWLYDIQDNKLKGTNRPLGGKDLRKILINEPLGTINDVQTKMNRIYNEYPTLAIDEPNVDNISKMITWVLANSCDDIAGSLFKGIRKYLEIA